MRSRVAGIRLYASAFPAFRASVPRSGSAPAAGAALSRRAMTDVRLKQAAGEQAPGGAGAFLPLTVPSVGCLSINVIIYKLADRAAAGPRRRRVRSGGPMRCDVSCGGGPRAPRRARGRAPAAAAPRPEARPRPRARHDASGEALDPLPGASGARAPPPRRNVLNERETKRESHVINHHRDPEKKFFFLSH